MAAKQPLRVEKYRALFDYLNLIVIFRLSNIDSLTLDASSKPWIMVDPSDLQTSRPSHSTVKGVSFCSLLSSQEYEQSGLH